MLDGCEAMPDKLDKPIVCFEVIKKKLATLKLTVIPLNSQLLRRVNENKIKKGSSIYYFK
jgi:hypothetical protein